MRSPTAKRILSETSEQQKQEVRNYANKLIRERIKKLEIQINLLKEIINE